jgi:hypothetical protein
MGPAHGTRRCGAEEYCTLHGNRVLSPCIILSVQQNSGIIRTSNNISLYTNVARLFFLFSEKGRLRTCSVSRSQYCRIRLCHSKDLKSKVYCQAGANQRGEVPQSPGILLIFPPRRVLFVRSSENEACRVADADAQFINIDFRVLHAFQCYGFPTTWSHSTI